MRISSQQIFDSGINSVQRHTAEVVEAQRQISSGHKYNRASDSALAAGLGVQITFDNAQFAMFKVNQDHLNQVYATLDTQTKSIHDALAAFQQLMVQANNGTLSVENIQILGDKADRLLSTVSMLAGVSKDDNGHWILNSNSVFQPIKFTLAKSIDANGNTTYGPLNFASTESTAAKGVDLQNQFSLHEVMGGDQFLNDQIDAFLTSQGVPLGDREVLKTDLQNRTVDKKVDVLNKMKEVVDALKSTTSLASAPVFSGNGVDLFNDINKADIQIARAQVKVGLLQNQLDAAVQFAESEKLNAETARSNLLDTDLPQSTAQLAKSNALLQAAQSIITKLDTNTLFQKL